VSRAKGSADGRRAKRAAGVSPEHVVATMEADGQLVPFDETLLERARTQWQFGDWASLQRIEHEQLQHHPDRAKLALLAAAGRSQALDAQIQARQFARLARDWGCPPKLMAQVLIAGVYDTLGRAAILAGDHAAALRHFGTAASTGAPGADTALLARARADHQAHAVRAHASNHARLASAADPKSAAAPAARQSEAQLRAVIDRCFAADDVLECIDSCVAKSEGQSRFDLLCAAADEFALRGDRMTARGFLASAADQLSDTDAAKVAELARKLARLGTADQALDLLVQWSLRDPGLGVRERVEIEGAYERLRRPTSAAREHGHDLLLSHLRAHWSTLKAAFGSRRPLLVEIGSTRENVPGQGSTGKLAECCRAYGIDMVTVDMDPHNTANAAALFRSKGLPFLAITCKGEDYLREAAGPIDFVFLDAYDFDHGQHSELRQSRYRKFLGSPIDDAACHAMHLDCARSLADKLAPGGLICFDDTWIVDDRWTAKGTTAMPFLLANGFEVIEARNRAALLRRRAAGV
jgi:hypothetical protein